MIDDKPEPTAFPRSNISLSSKGGFGMKTKIFLSLLALLLGLSTAPATAQLNRRCQVPEMGTGPSSRGILPSIRGASAR